ncbi:MAG: hypothetical protein ACLPKB_15560 [Xanthobacteraceae bacterium]
MDPKGRKRRGVEMKIHMQLPLPPMPQPAPPKPATPGWMSQLLAEEELAKAMQRRRILERRRLNIQKEDQRSDSEQNEPESRPSGEKLDFLA